MRLWVLLIGFLPTLALSEETGLSTQGTSGAVTPVTPWAARGPYVTPETTPVPPVLTMQGTVASVDPAFGRFAVATANGTLDWLVSTNTPVVYRFVQVGVRGLHPGDAVRVTYNLRPSYIIRVEQL